MGQTFLLIERVGSPGYVVQFGRTAELLVGCQSTSPRGVLYDGVEARWSAGPRFKSSHTHFEGRSVEQAQRTVSRATIINEEEFQRISVG